MLKMTSSRSEDILSEVIRLARERLVDEPQAAVEAFLWRYYAGTAVEDLAEFDLVNLYGAAVSHWNFARQRQPGTPKVRVYNPQLDQHGWQSPHTIVEIVTDDMPFLVDSVRMAIHARGLTSHLIIHPVMRFKRDAEGRIVAVLEPDGKTEGMLTEAVMHVEVDRQTESEALDGMLTALRSVLADVCAAVQDWRPMRAKLHQLLAELEQFPPPIPEEELAEGRAFLEWIDDNNFTFLGYREYELFGDDDDPGLCSVPHSGLGLLGDDDAGHVSRSFACLPAEVRSLARNPELLVLTKANSRSTVHRPTYLDYVGVKRFDQDGRVVGERRFLGLYTSAAYTRTPRVIPLLRRKVARVLERAAYPENSHAAKALLHILETFPRELLFQLPEHELYETVTGILQMQERQRIRLFIHRDRFRRFFSCIIYVPRDRHNTEVRRAIEQVLTNSLRGVDLESNVQLSESVLARLYLVIRVQPEAVPEYDVHDIEARLRDIARTWTDDLYTALLEYRGEEAGTRLFRRYGEAFRADYRQNYAARLAVHDIERMETLDGTSGQLAMSLYRPLEARERLLQFKLFRLGIPIPLSEALPMLENMGLKVEDERPSKIERVGAPTVWVHDFGMLYDGDEEIDLDKIKAKFQEGFARIWHGDVENDGFNRLVLGADLTWREIVIIRAYCKYLRQVGVAFSQAYMEHTLTGNAHVARLLVQLFHARCQLEYEYRPEETPEAIVAAIYEALDGVASLDEDRILRSFLSVILATLRTNFYQTDAAGKPRPYVSFKFDPRRIPELPEPRPLFEIFVYSPRLEGVHLRGGPVARGGIRWSDRKEDFRTEVLGLMKAQMVKNAVIVPVGSKGGFVPKRLPVGGDREAIQAEGVACYQTFIRGLLDITDNLVGGEVVPPLQVVRHDGDDPYLVVAADKGTATFSDIANDIAGEYGFWLGDAFASGGSQGYDHKGMKITARGGWESVKRHFRELGLDTQSSDFTAVGIGDMSGDVFGNGMLLSRHLKLLGAFNHQHIFLDPHPDPETSFRERERLFKLPRSTWQDYNAMLISKGGGVYPRTAKSISISPEAREVLKLDTDHLPPNELIQAILKAQVDLLWNGGIGTYVKASDEHHDQVGDRSNDAVRVNAAELRCRVVGEGGNLGFTQLGRIEFASRGGRINTDAIDNSAGVDCSDHEVNIKILLNRVVADGDLTEKQRNRLLVEMSDEVATLVLRHNYLQTQALSVARTQAASLLDVHTRLMRELERKGELVRAIEYLPPKEEIDERMALGQGLTVPELSVLMAYMKIVLFKDLLASDLPTDSFLAMELEHYFPTPIQKRFRDHLPEHRLACEIISTVVANDIVNRCGITFAFRLAEETGADYADVARAYMVAREIFDMPRLWAEIEALDSQISAQDQLTMLLESRKLVERAARWLLRNRPQPLDIAATIEHFAAGATTLSDALPRLVPPISRRHMSRMAQKLMKAGVSKSLAQRIATFDELVSCLDIIEVAKDTCMAVKNVAAVYFELSERLDLHWLREQILRQPRENRWQALARTALRDDLYNQASTLTRDALRIEVHKAAPQARIDAWVAQNPLTIKRCRQILADLKSAGKTDFAMLSVAMREIRELSTLKLPLLSAPSIPAQPRRQGKQTKSKASQKTSIK